MVEFFFPSGKHGVLLNYLMCAVNFVHNHYDIPLFLSPLLKRATVPRGAGQSLKV